MYFKLSFVESFFFSFFGLYSALIVVSIVISNNWVILGKGALHSHCMHTMPWHSKTYLLTLSRRDTSCIVLYTCDVFGSEKLVCFILWPDLQLLDTDNFQLENPETFNGMQAYKNTKLCNLLTAYRLAEKLRGQKVMVNAVDPGNFRSDNDNISVIPWGPNFRVAGNGWSS